MTNAVIDKNGIAWFGRVFASSSGYALHYMDGTGVPIERVILNNQTVAPGSLFDIRSGPVIDEEGKYLYIVIRAHSGSGTTDRQLIVKIDADTRDIAGVSPDSESLVENRFCTGTTLYGNHLYSIYDGGINRAIIRKNDISTNDFTLVDSVELPHRPTGGFNASGLTNNNNMLHIDSDGNLYYLGGPGFRIIKVNQDFEVVGVTKPVARFAQLEDFKEEVDEINANPNLSNVVHSWTSAITFRLTEDRIKFMTSTGFYSSTRVISGNLQGRVFSNFEIDKHTLQFLQRTKVSPLRVKGEGISDGNLGNLQFGHSSMTKKSERTLVTPTFDNWKYLAASVSGGFSTSNLRIIECEHFREESSFLGGNLRITFNVNMTGIPAGNFFNASIPAAQDIIFVRSQSDGTFAFDFEGNQLWNVPTVTTAAITTCPEPDGSPHGYARTGNSVRAFNANDGSDLWDTSLATPLQITVGRTKVLVSRHNFINALDPYTGAVLWQVPVSQDVGSFGSGLVCEDPVTGVCYGVISGEDAVFIYKISAGGIVEISMNITNPDELTYSPNPLSQRGIIAGDYLHYNTGQNYFIRNKHTLEVVDTVPSSEINAGGMYPQLCPTGVMWNGIRIIKEDQIIANNATFTTRVEDDLTRGTGVGISGIVRIIQD